jgi:EAL domain-containing protein (putative c-di-GMP-specific phosphodiesterase class I)
MSIEALAERRERRLTRGSVIDSDRIVPLSDGVIEADDDLRIVAVNAAAAELLGWGHPAELSSHLRRRGHGLLPAGTDREIRVALAARGRWSGRVPLVRRDGTQLDAAVTACVLHSSAGLPTGIVVTFRPLAAVAATASAGRSATQGDLYGVTGLPGHFSLYFQPEIDLRTSQVVAAEALLRWWHPGLGIVAPGPALANRRWGPRLAELEVWSIFAACRQVAAWSSRGRLPIAVNVSRHHLDDRELVPRVRRALTASGIDPALLTLDLPAASVLHDPEKVGRTVRRLAELGVAVAIDDVTPAVPRAALSAVRAPVLKLARPSRNALAVHEADAVHSSGVSLARRLGASTVAKAVETGAELDQLRAVGCDRAFGHLFSPPRPPEDLARALWGAAPEPAVRRPRAPYRAPGPLAWRSDAAAG